VLDRLQKEIIGSGGESAEKTAGPAAPIGGMAAELATVATATGEAEAETA
jgi:hypothetical protein